MDIEPGDVVLVQPPWSQETQVALVCAVRREVFRADHVEVALGRSVHPAGLVRRYGEFCVQDAEDLDEAGLKYETGFDMNARVGLPAGKVYFMSGHLDVDDERIAKRLLRAVRETLPHTDN